MARRSAFGHVHQRKRRDGTTKPGYYVRLRVHGKEIVRWAGPDKRTAQEYAARVLRESSREHLLDERSVAALSFAETETAFRAAYASDHGETSVRGDSGRIARLVSWFGEKPLKDASAGDVSDLVTALRSEGSTPATVNRYLSVLSAWFGFATKRGYARENPAKGNHLREEAKPVPFVGDADLAAVLTKEPNQRFAAAFRVLGDTGLRRGEFGRLERRDFDRARGIVLVRRSKSGQPREVPLTQAAKAAVESLLGPLPMKGPDPIWTTCVDDLSKRFAAAAKAAGFDLTLHALRHSCASRLIQRGVPVPVVAKILGHKCHSTTLRYVHLAPGATHDAMKSLDKPIEGDKGTLGGTQASATAHA